MPHKVHNEILIPEMDILLREGKDVRFTPTGFSMRPFIEGEKDAVVLRRPSTFRVGDIVLASANNQYLLHRIIAINGEHITLQGDGNLSVTEQCRTADIIGTVIQIYNADGKPKRLTRGRLWFYLRPCRRILLKIYRKLL